MPKVRHPCYFSKLCVVVAGENLVPKSQVQVQEASERKGNGRTKSTQPGKNGIKSCCPCIFLMPVKSDELNSVPQREMKKSRWLNLLNVEFSHFR